MLPPATETVWNYLKEQPALAGFVLAGGSALALTLHHRLSEALDFIYPETRLPGQRLDALRRQASEAGFTFQRNDDEAAVQDFAQSTLELHDYQQDFLVNGVVKVSFFAPDDALRKVFARQSAPNARVAVLAELFKAKCLVSAVRSKTRDRLDLYLLMRDHGFTIRDYQAAFQEAGNPAQCDIGLARLCSGVPQRGDEGFAPLLANAPSVEEMKAFFTAQRQKLEIEIAAEAKQQQQRTSTPPAAS